jgi:ubiquinone/menaquinone biosynthesis C-methylase UbiE
MLKLSLPTVEIYPDLRPRPPQNGIWGRVTWAVIKGFSALLRLAFHLLYYPLAFTYDAVAWIVSGGEWADWRRSVLPYLLPGRVLELAHGTGTLALEMADRGFDVAAVDLSPSMGKIASKKKRTRAAPKGKRAPHPSTPSPDPKADLALIRADVRQLPFQNEFFSSAVSTFPADFIFQPRTVLEARRILRPGGRWIIVPTAYPEWIASRLLPVEKIAARKNVFGIFTRHLEAAGFTVRIEIIRRPRSRVMLILAEK